MIQLGTNSNGAGEDYFLLAILDNTVTVHSDDGVSTDLILAGDQNCDYQYQTVFSIEDIIENAAKMIGTIMSLLAIISYV